MLHRSFGWIALGVLAAAVSPASAADPFWGDLDIALGDGVTSTFVRAGETHEFSFFGTAGTRVDAAVAADGGSAVVAGLRLLRPGGYEVPTGRFLAETRSGARLRAFVLPYSGWFVLEASARSGTGAYRLTTSARASRSLRGLFAGADGDEEFRFHATAGTRLAAVVRAASRRSGVRPRIHGLVDPEGAPIAVVATDRARSSSIGDVPLPVSGEYTLLFENAGRRGEVELRLRFGVPPGANLDRILPPSAGIPSSRVEAGDQRIAAADGFIGSGACGRCHDTTFREWTRTAHHLAVRPWNQPGLTGAAFVNDANRNGVDDFRDGLDLATQPAFAAYGANAPRLSYVAGAETPYRMTIGAATYEVVRTMGGNGTWKQRYLLRSGNHMVPSPVQFNEAARVYAAYEPLTWYDGANAPLYTGAAQVPKDRSFEARCSGCHNTGERIQVDPQTGDFLTGCVDFNVGCEQCHGPGAEHARTGDRTKIENPRNFADGTQAGLVRANDACGRCHTRGDAHDAFPGTATKAGFPYSAAGGVAQLGDDLDLFFVETTNPADFWGRKTNPFPALPGDTWVASKSHRQQSLDVAAGAHAPNAEGDAPACFDCHDPHARRSEHQIVTSVRRPVDVIGKRRHDAGTLRIRTRSDDNSLCLSCHAGTEPFAGAAAADVAQISSGTPPASVVDAVVRHMSDRGMHVARTLYDPAGTGVGNCVTCHMPLVGRTAAFTADAAGLRKGDLHSHLFRTIPARASHLYTDAAVGMSNSCSTCHPTRAGDAVATILTQWATDTGADGVFHGDTPRNFQNGVANAGGAGGGAPCVRCHTTEGFVEEQVKGRTLTQGETDRIVKDAIARDKGISCDACHGSRADGTFDLRDRQPLRMPKGELCGSCHNGQTVVFADFRDRGEMIRHPTREMLLGTAGSESPGHATWTDTAHSGFEDQCVACHYDPEVAGATHTFAPQVATCAQCHAGLGTFNRPSANDWDGDGNVAEGIQGEVRGLQDRVKAALVVNPEITFTAGGFFEYGAATDHKLTGATEAEKRAAYNWYSVEYDGSAGVHNAARAVQLLQRSYRELTGMDVPGAVLR